MPDKPTGHVERAYQAATAPKRLAWRDLYEVDRAGWWCIVGFALLATVIGVIAIAVGLVR